MSCLSSRFLWPFMRLLLLALYQVFFNNCIPRSVHTSFSQTGMCNKSRLPLSCENNYIARNLPLFFHPYSAIVHMTPSIDFAEGHWQSRCSRHKQGGCARNKKSIGWVQEEARGPCKKQEAEGWCIAEASGFRSEGVAGAKGRIVGFAGA